MVSYRSPENAEFGHLTLLYCRGRQRNVLRNITHVHSHCSENAGFTLKTPQVFSVHTKPKKLKNATITCNLRLSKTRNKTCLAGEAKH